MTPPFTTDTGLLVPWARSLWVYGSVLFVDALVLPMASSLYVAALGNVHPPLVVAAVGAAGTTLGSVAQYGIVRWLLRRWPARKGALARLRRRIERSVGTATTATTAALLVVYATPLSAGPLRLIAAASGFPLWRFALAIGLGCLPYYFVLAVLGRLVHFPMWILVPALAIVFGFGAVHVVRAWRNESPEETR